MDRGPGEASQGLWGSDAAAQAWRQGEARRAQQFGPATERMLDLAGIHPGSRVLDAAAGTGEQTLLAAHRVGPTGYVLATDIAPSMLEAARSAARQAGLTQVATHLMDARQVDLEPASFDAIICRNGLQWIPDPDQALVALRRVLRPGGKLVALVHGAPELNPFVVLPANIVRRIGSLPPPSPTEPDSCALGGPGVLDALYRRAGLRDVEVHSIRIERQFPSASAAVAAIRDASAYLRSLMTQLSDAQCQQAWADIEQAFQGFVTPTGVDLSGQSLIGVGTR